MLNSFDKLVVKMTMKSYYPGEIPQYISGPNEKLLFQRKKLFKYIIFLLIWHVIIFKALIH